MADEINAAGGVNGRQIKVITYDTKADVRSHQCIHTYEHNR